MLTACAAARASEFMLPAAAATADACAIASVSLRLAASAMALAAAAVSPRAVAAVMRHGTLMLTQANERQYALAIA